VRSPRTPVKLPPRKPQSPGSNPSVVGVCPVTWLLLVPTVTLCHCRLVGIGWCCCWYRSVLLLVSVGVLIVVAVVDVVVVVVVGGGGVVKEKKLENGERPMMAPPKPRKPKSITTSRHMPARSEVVCVSGGTRPPPGRKHRGTRGDAENSLWCTGSPRTPPMLHAVAGKRKAKKEIRCRYGEWR